MDEAEWVRAVTQAGPGLLALARRIVRDEASAEDVVAETYLRAWQKRGQLQRRGRLLPWLRRICRNCALDLQRRRARDPLGSHAPLAAAAGDASTPVPGELGRSELLDRLPDKLKAVARMRFVDGLGHSEIAQIERLPTSTVRGRIYMAREAIRKEIEMTAERSEPRSDAWDDGEVPPSPDNVLRWRGMRLRLLGTWRPGQKGFYGPSGRRLSRVPKAVRQSHVFQHWDTFKWVDPAQHALVFFRRTGEPGYAFVRGCQTSSDCYDHSHVVYSLLADADAVKGRRRIMCTVIGPVVEDEEAAVRFRLGFVGDCEVTAIPGWGAAFVSRAQSGDSSGTCGLSVAYSSSTVKTDWAVRGLLDDDGEVDPAGFSQAASQCNEGDITGLALTLPVSPDRLRGIVFRPRWHATVDWGMVAMPPAAG